MYVVLASFLPRVIYFVLKFLHSVFVVIYLFVSFVFSKYFYISIVLYLYSYSLCVYFVLSLFLYVCIYVSPSFVRSSFII